MNADIDGCDNDIIVRWFEYPTNPQQAVDALARMFKTKIPGYTTWI